MKTNKLSFLVLVAVALFFTACAPTTKEDPEAAAAKERTAAMEKNKMVVGKIFKALEANSVDSLVTYFADNMLEHAPAPGGSTTGPQSQRDLMKFYGAAFPVVKFTNISMLADGDMVVAHFNIKGKNSGPMGEMPATNKDVDVNGVDIYKMENGKVAEHWAYFEEGKMMMQLGMMGDQKADAKKK